MLHHVVVPLGGGEELSVPLPGLRAVSRVHWESTFGLFLAHDLYYDLKIARYHAGERSHYRHVSSFLTALRDDAECEMLARWGCASEESGRIPYARDYRGRVRWFYLFESLANPGQAKYGVSFQLDVRMRQHLSSPLPEVQEGLHLHAAWRLPEAICGELEDLFDWWLYELRNGNSEWFTCTDWFLEEQILNRMPRPHRSSEQFVRRS